MEDTLTAIQKQEEERPINRRDRKLLEEVLVIFRGQEQRRQQQLKALSLKRKILPNLRTMGAPTRALSVHPSKRDEVSAALEAITDALSSSSSDGDSESTATDSL